MGFADVEEDGSAHFEVPANVPFTFYRSMPKNGPCSGCGPSPIERQSCIGCHSDRNYASSTGLSGRPSISASRPVQKLTEPDWGNRDGFSFESVVQPVLDKHCVTCHDDTSELDLSDDRTDYFNAAYENLARRGTQPEHGSDARGGMEKFGRNPYTSWIPTFYCTVELPLVESGSEIPVWSVAW